ncbi:MAG: phosphate ABC transporter permease PstA [Candidatus Goldbacteria bacterium]|nr:phosphate ABC transporter permease PstA [Candidatus Goldiibacteriota bacterium]HPD18060.1 phosphate ABC transporter permease PstA [Candidatus Goldiibacteriota bacterium]
MKEEKIINKIRDVFFPVAGLLAVIISLGILFVLIIDVFKDGFMRLDFQFLTSYPSRKAEKAGILSAWVGTIWIMSITAFLIFPIGVAAGIYLEEYAKSGKLRDFLEINISNLAGVPSIIYGLLGLQVFVYFFRLDRSVLAGALTLSLVVLPIVIVATRESLKAVPLSLREASFALGATKLQTIIFQVLPSAFSGILSGVILAMSRAIGETAPLITIGALTYIAFLPTGPFTTEFPFITLQGLKDYFTVLPIQIFNWISRPQKAFHANAAAGILILLIISLFINFLAVYLRIKFEKHSGRK